MNTIKGRGRPVGSGKNDAVTLMQVARLMVRDPSLKPTTAMKRVIAARKDWPERDETLLRRLQIKWRTPGQNFLDRARRELVSPLLPEIFAGIDAGLSRLDRFMRSPEVAQTLSKWDSAFNKFLNSPETTTVFEAAAALERKWKEAAASSPLFDVYKLAAFEQSLKRFSPPTLTRRYVGGGFLSTPLLKG